MNPRRGLATSLTRWSICAAAAVVLTGCDRAENGKATIAKPEGPLATAARATPAESAAMARRQIVRWLECEECIAGELAAVQALGQSAIPTLAATLLDGPSAASREKMRLHLVDAYREMQESANAGAGEPVSGSEADFVQEYLGNYESVYRVRSAQALAAIGGLGADDALRAFQAHEASTGLHTRREVQAAVDAALKQLAETPATGP